MLLSLFQHERATQAKVCPQFKVSMSFVWKWMSTSKRQLIPEACQCVHSGPRFLMWSNQLVVRCCGLLPSSRQNSEGLSSASCAIPLATVLPFCTICAEETSRTSSLVRQVSGPQYISHPLSRRTHGPQILPPATGEDDQRRWPTDLDLVLLIDTRLQEPVVSGTRTDRNCPVLGLTSVVLSSRAEFCDRCPLIPLVHRDEPYYDSQYRVIVRESSPRAQE